MPMFTNGTLSPCKCIGIDPNLVWIILDVKYFRYLHLSDVDLKEPLFHVGMQEDAERLFA